MEINFGLLFVIALLVLLGYWRERALNLYRQALGEANEQRAAANAREELLLDARESLKRRVAELEGRGVRERAAFDDQRTTMLREWAAERHELWERIQRPDLQPVAADGTPGVQRKLHFTEDDEIEGRTIADVAAGAGLSPTHERYMRHVDEIATQEGVSPAS